MTPKPGHKRRDSKYGNGVVAIDDPAGEFLDSTLQEALEAEIQRDSWRPPTLPRVALEILQLTQNPACSVDAIIETLEKDPLITGRVFKLAQSPLYAGASKLSSLRQAIVRLGQNTVRDLVVQVSLETKIFRHPTLGPVLEDVWTHSHRVAQLSRMVARMTPFESELAFLTGLLHDVGMAGALLLAAELKLDQDAPVIALVGAANSIHQKLGAKMVTEWGMPPEVSFAIASHHTLYDGGVANPHAAILIVAESLDETTHKVDVVTPPKIAFEATQVLGLSEAAVNTLLKEAMKIGAGQAA